MNKLSISGIVLLALALLKMPYGYYTFMRIALAIIGITLLINLYKKHQTLAILSGAIAILYNPVIPIHLDRHTWMYLNIATIILLAITLKRK